MLPTLLRGQTHTLLWFASEASQDVQAPVRLPIAFNGSGRLPKITASSLASSAQQSKHPRPAHTAGGDQGNAAKAIDKW
jgi:hypothetical protein